MNTIARLLAITALALTLPACAATPKKSCCATKKCTAGDSSCKAPMKKSN
jgi:hypothetical protein